MAAGIVLAITVFVAQQPETSVAIDWTTILIAFLTGAFGSNGISKIIDSFATLQEVKELRRKLDEQKENHRLEMLDLKDKMRQQQIQHNAELRKILRLLTEGKDDGVTPAPG